MNNIKLLSSFIFLCTFTKFIPEKIPSFYWLKKSDFRSQRKSPTLSLNQGPNHVARELAKSWLSNIILVFNLVKRCSPNINNTTCNMRKLSLLLTMVRANSTLQSFGNVLEGYIRQHISVITISFGAPWFITYLLQSKMYCIISIT